MRMHYFTLVPLLFLFACLDMQAGIYGILSGTVTDSTNTPVTGATVRVEGTTRGAYVKPDGSFTILKVPAGTYTIRIKALGFQDRTQTVVIHPDQTTQISMTLLRGAQAPVLVVQIYHGTLTGKVVDENDEPLVGATVRIEGTTRGGYTKANGSFTIAKIPLGTYTVRIQSLGYKDYTHTVAITADTNEYVAAILSLVEKPRHPFLKRMAYPDSIRTSVYIKSMGYGFGGRILTRRAIPRPYWFLNGVNTRTTLPAGKESIMEIANTYLGNFTP